MSLGGRSVVVRRDRQDAVRPGASHIGDQIDHAPSVVTARAGEHGHPPGRRFHDQLHHAPLLGTREGRALAGGAARNEEVDTRVDLARRQTLHGWLVHGPVGRERRHQCRSTSGPVRCHHLSARGAASLISPRTSRIENQPCRPCTQRAASSAPRANVARSRVVCVRAIVSLGPSNPTVWVPGAAPTRVDAMSMARSYPCLRHLLPQRERGARWGVDLGGVVDLVNPGAEFLVRSSNSRAARAARSRNRLTPREKLAAATTPIPASSAIVPHRALFGGPPGGADHEVDPMLRQSGQGVDHGVGSREVDGHIDVAHPISRDTGAAMVVVDVEPAPPPRSHRTH